MCLRVCVTAINVHTVCLIYSCEIWHHNPRYGMNDSNIYRYKALHNTALLRMRH